MCIAFGGVRIVNIFLWHANSDGGEGGVGGEKKPSDDHWGPSPAASEIHEILLGEGATPAKQSVKRADPSDECVLVTVATRLSGGGDVTCDFFILRAKICGGSLQFNFPNTA